MQRVDPGQPVSAAHPGLCRPLHILLVTSAFTALFAWLYGRTVVLDEYLSWSDLYEYFLPGFLSKYVHWSTYEFGGVPTFADFSEPTVQPVFLLFSKVIGSWIGYVLAAHVLTALGTYLYVTLVSGSRAAGAVAGIGFGLSEAMLERLAHMTTIHTMAWMPFLFFCVERLLVTRAPRWAALGALCVAMAILAGHPQPAMYVCLAGAAYAITGGRALKCGRDYWIPAAWLFVLGGMLTLVKILPFGELTLSLSRDTISYGHFITFANTPAQMWSMLFPTILHDGRESPTYVTLALVIFSMVGVSRLRRDWRIAFWLVVAIVGILISLGDATPFARLVYTAVPLYDKFRVGSRHLIVSCFGLAVLAGFGVQFVVQNLASARARLLSLAVFAALFAAGLWVMTHPPAGLQFENRYSFAWSQHGLPPVMPNELWTQVVIALATLLLSAGVMFGRPRVLFLTLLAVTLSVDAINAQPFQVGRLGLDSVTMPVKDAQPSVHAEQIRQELLPLHQRALAIGSTSTDAIAPAVWARLWEVPIAGGYGPMLFERLSKLAAMGRNGGITNRPLSANSAALDVVAVREIIVKPSDIESSGSFELDGITWEKQPLDIAVGRSDCNQRYARTIRLAVPPGTRLSAVHATMYLRCAEEVEQGSDVGAVTLVAADGTRHERRLRAGIDVSESSLTEESVRARAHHQASPRVQDPDAPSAVHSLVTLSLPQPVTAEYIEVSAAASPGWLNVGRLTYVDEAGRMLPQTMGPLFLQDADRWRELRRIRTSRLTDRGRDEDVRDETEFTIYENRRALARVWLTSEVRVMRADDVLGAITNRQLPDGGPFDPAVTALLAEEDEPGAEARRFATGAASVQIDEMDNGRMAATVNSAGGGFLVFSENYYRGWRATVDGERVPVQQANYTLQGIVVPPGSHRVEFTFYPYSMYVGGAFSLAALLGVGMLSVRKAGEANPPAAASAMDR